MEIEGKSRNMAKAKLPIVATVLGIVVGLHPVMSLLVAVSIIALQPFLLSYTVLPASTVMDVKLLQYTKALPSMWVTEAGMVIEVNLVQSLKALCSIFVTELGMVMDCNLVASNAKIPIVVTEEGMVTEVKP